MTFAASTNNDPLKCPSGEIRGTVNTLISQTVFENGLNFGRFLKVDTGSIDMLDGSATPVIAGVGVRDVTNPIGDALTYNTTNTRKIDVCMMGLITVDALAGESPTFKAPIYAKNAGAGDFGKASVSATTAILTDAVFIEKITDTVWLVLLK